MSLIAYLKDFSDKVDGNISEYIFLILYTEICQYLEGLCNLVNGYFLNDQCMILKSLS